MNNINIYVQQLLVKSQKKIKKIQNASINQSQSSINLPKQTTL
jgi:hypothetical protein